MKIGELSRRTGVSVRMLRYYEAEGLLAPPRTDSGYRDYGPAEEETVRRIKMLGAAGMTLETIQLAELRMSRITILRRAKRGSIPSFRVGSCVRFTLLQSPRPAARPSPA